MATNLGYTPKETTTKKSSTTKKKDTLSFDKSSYYSKDITNRYNPATVEVRPLDTYSYDDLYANLTGEVNGTSSSSRGGGAHNIDVSALLDAYNKGAEQQVKAAQDSYNYNKENLLRSLQRYQDENAKEQLAQLQSLNSTQAAMEDNSFAQDRTTRVNNALRGLSGSGVQQLAQLSNLASQANQISNIASSNDKTMNKLRDALSSKEEDALTALTLLNDETNKSIQDAYAKAGANAGNAALEAAINNAKSAYSASSSSSSADAESAEASRALYNLLGNLDAKYDRELNRVNNMSKKELKKYSKDVLGMEKGTSKLNDIKQEMANNYYATLETYNTDYGIDTANYNKSLRNIDSLLRQSNVKYDALNNVTSNRKRLK